MIKGFWWCALVLLITAIALAVIATLAVQKARYGG